MNIYKSCCLCLKEDNNNGDDLIWRDGMQLCKKCYDEYTENDYNKRIMPIKAIKDYRRTIAEYAESEESKINEYIKKDIIREKITALEDYIAINSDEQGYWGSRDVEELYTIIEAYEKLL